MRKLLPILLLALGLLLPYTTATKADSSSGTTFSVTKAATPDTVAPSASVSFSITIKNITTAGSPNATFQTITDTLPAGFTFTAGSSQLVGLDGSTGAFAPTAAGQVLTWSFSGTSSISMAPQDSVVINFSATAPSVVGNYTNQACMTAPENVCANAAVTVQSGTPNTGLLENLAIAGGLGVLLVLYSVYKSRSRASFEERLLNRRD